MHIGRRTVSVTRSLNGVRTGSTMPQPMALFELPHDLSGGEIWGHNGVP
jgi:hypothetical protein